jgi:hypothetical protein
MSGLPLVEGFCRFLPSACIVFIIANAMSACTIASRLPEDRLAGDALDNLQSFAPIEHCAMHSTPAGTDKYCVSSVLQQDEVVNKFNYGPDSLFDNLENTAWVEGVDGQGIGEWITIEFDQPRLIKAIEIKNGYNKDPYLYLKNSRVKEITVEFSGSVKTSAVLEDTGSTQLIRLPNDLPIRAYGLKLTIESVYPGTKFADTAISELHVVSEPVTQ